MEIYYFEEDGVTEFDKERARKAPRGRWGRKNEKINDPVTITLHIEIDKAKYDKLKQKFKTSLEYRIFSYFGFKEK